MSTTDETTMDLLPMPPRWKQRRHGSMWPTHRHRARCRRRIRDELRRRG